ncbi:restriction endonuclease [Chryseobacterium sp. Leaf404]|uniref:Uma2 family endonuclease n=1 Tax=unclassified Chryseobacterium TaxID=2593645 RepID=UPI0006FA4EB5|nr:MULTISPECIES: Uma2 family endonuclease [unclassified Chryseobacterium]KQT19282.1 restriction endonuclease [Chryseobacterium sp. Leaf404]
MEITSLSQLDMDATYTYADYLMWRLKERVELFRGKILKMSPAPSPVHQKISFRFSGIFYNFFKNNPCEVFPAPFDVRFPSKNGDSKSVFQPDLCVICDPKKIDDKGCVGAPDLIVEIISPGNSKKELSLKYSIYEEFGVLEYWVVHPVEKTIQIFVLENGIFIGKKPITEDEEIKSYIFADLAFPASEIFENI